MTGLAIHMIVYVSVNLLLIALWILMGGSASEIPTYLTNLSAARDAKFWPIYSILFWGVGLVIHAGVVVVTYPKRIRQQRARRRARANIHRTVMGILDGTMLEGAALAAIRATDGDAAAKRVKKEVRKARVENVGRSDRQLQEARPSRSRSDSRSQDRRDRRRPGPRDKGSTASTDGHRDEATTADQPTPGRTWFAVMFTDIVESTRLNDQLGDEQWAAMLGDHRSAVRECVQKHGGVEVGTQGDGFLLRFSSPDAAAACATELQRSWSAARVASATTGETPLPAVRIGIHAGEVLREDDDLVGKVINLASRVTDVAEPDEILVTEPLADHLTDDIKLVDRGLRTLKGFDRPRHLLAIVWQDAPVVLDLASDPADVETEVEPT